MSTVQTLFKVNGMHCGSCVKVVTKRVSGLDGVEVDSLTADGDLVLSSERPVTVEEVREALKETAYTVED